MKQKKETNHLDGKELKDIYNHLAIVCKDNYHMSYDGRKKINAMHLMDRIDGLLENLKIEVK